MPPQSRAQRRRQAARQQGRATSAPSAATARQQGRAMSAPSAEATSAASTGATVPLAPSAGARQARPARRVISRAAPEPVDYSKDYNAVRRDLRWIALWTVLLFAAMIALKFSGLV
jgi:hypothetical protein